MHLQQMHFQLFYRETLCDREVPMEFGYFTLSDNHYENNTRSSNQFVADITDQALYADKLGMHSAWIGEHHFNSLGVLSCPDLVLSYVAAQTKRIRLAPAVTVTPLHHPIRVAEQWATLDLLSGGRVDFACGRGYDRREYKPFHVPSRQILLLRRCAHHAEAGAETDSDLCGIILEALHRARRAVGVRTDRGALCGGAELRRVEAGFRSLP
jgi:hypothetical protein